MKANSENDRDSNLLSSYAQRRLLLSTEITVLREAIVGCDPEHLQNIMEMMEDELMEYSNDTSNLGTVQHILCVWFIALRSWDIKTSDIETEHTRLDFETLKYEQHWDS